MIIKKFEGKTEGEALEAAKKELGAAVVIMNVREVKSKGILGFFRGRKVEVTVALEEEPDKVLPAAKQGEAQTAYQTLPPLRPEAFVLAKNQGTQSQEAAAVSAAILQSQQSAAQNQMPPARPAVRPATGIDLVSAPPKVSEVLAQEEGIEKRLDNLQDLLEKNLKKQEETKTGVSEKKEEEAQSKNDMEAQVPGKEGDKARFLKLLKTTLLDNEVDEVYADEIIDELGNVLKPNMPIDYMLSDVYQKMILKFGEPSRIMPAFRGPKVVFFVGPTGVGKTTTIAKVAGRFSVIDKKKVALLTTDTYRIAATEQLKTYANIMGVPFEVIYSEEDMRSVVTKYSSYDYLFVDTAGHSHQNTVQREAMQNFVAAVGKGFEKEIYLVLSATTKYKDLRAIADTYKAIGDYKLIFTKLDETTSYGNLLNVKLYTGAPMAYITYGQNVPDDMEEFNPQKTVKMLLGGSRSIG
ncbi:MAG: flagellar biosynthesis protein FlhF [Lachnospiraceae bacterium]|nr:flagellar biosynthesis protein FlhF [Lachnospiraceae bacterium]